MWPPHVQIHDLIQVTLVHVAKLAMVVDDGVALLSGQDVQHPPFIFEDGTDATVINVKHTFVNL